MDDKELKYNEMSNSELRIKMKEMENEYEAIKNKVASYLSRLDELDKNYNAIKGIFDKRSKGFI